MQIDPKDGGEVLHVTSQHQIELDSLARVIRFRMGARKGPTNFAIGRYTVMREYGGLVGTFDAGEVPLHGGLEESGFRCIYKHRHRTREYAIENVST